MAQITARCMLGTVHLGANLHGRINAFEKFLSVSSEDISFELSAFPPCPWAEFLLNPRRLRGSDFLMRWSQGVWSENRLVDAINKHGEFFALPYGPSGVAPEDDVREFELYFERLDAAGLGGMKRPDLLVFRAGDRSAVLELVRALGGEKELPFTSEDHKSMQDLLKMARIAVECENSLWVAEKMPAYGQKLRPMARLGGKNGLTKGAVLPTVIIKQEDRGPLARWQQRHKIPIHIWHVFFDRAYGISFEEAERLFKQGLIQPTIQTFQAPSGASSQKAIYKIYYHYAYELGKAKSSPNLIASYIEDKNGHILPYVKFDGGDLALYNTGLEQIRVARRLS